MEEKPNKFKKPNFTSPDRSQMKTLLVWTTIILAIMLLVSISGGNSATKQTFDVKQLVNAAKQENILELNIKNIPEGGKDWYLVEGKIENPKFALPDAPPDTKRTLDFIYEGRLTDSVYTMLTNEKVPWTVKQMPASTFWSGFFSGVFPFLLLFGIAYFLIARQMKAAGRNGMAFGKSKAKLLTPDKDRVSFDDVAGCDESKEEVAEIVEFLKNPKRFNDIGAKIPKGILMVGPPGTGKTLMARAIAGEANVPFFSISGSDFVELFVGVGAARVRDMFDQAKKAAPCLIFIDEIDAVGRQRGAGMGGGHDEREQTLNSLLVEMDGFDGHEGIIVIAATNRPDILDQALLRPGRFDRRVVIDLPDVVGREEILKVHAAKINLSKDVNLKNIARVTPGCSGAELANLLNESAIIAARHNKKIVDNADIDEARDKIFFGRERKTLMDADEKRLTAFHEAGHALLQVLIGEKDMPVHKVTIIPRGQSMGSTMFMPVKDVHMQKKSSLLNQICMALGGRVAEELVFKDVSTGASGDIKSATKIARKMVCDWGMSALGPVALGENTDHIFLGRDIAREEHFSEKTAQAIDSEISKIMDGQLDRARTLLSENMQTLEKIADALLKYETIDGKHLHEIIEFGEIKSPIESNNSPKKEVSSDVSSENAKSADTPNPDMPPSAPIEQPS